MLSKKSIEAFFVTDETPNPTVVKAGQMVELKLLRIDRDVVDGMNQIIGRSYYLPADLEISQYTGDVKDRGKTVPTASVVYVATSSASQSDPERIRRLLQALAQTYTTSVKLSFPNMIPRLRKIVKLDGTAENFYKRL